MSRGAGSEGWLVDNREMWSTSAGILGVLAGVVFNSKELRVVFWIILAALVASFILMIVSGRIIKRRSVCRDKSASRSLAMRQGDALRKIFDPAFAHKHSIGTSWRVSFFRLSADGLRWERLARISSDPKMAEGGRLDFDRRQGVLGNAFETTENVPIWQMTRELPDRDQRGKEWIDAQVTWFDVGRAEAEALRFAATKYLYASWAVPEMDGSDRGGGNDIYGLVVEIRGIEMTVTDIATQCPPEVLTVLPLFSRPLPEGRSSV